MDSTIGGRLIIVEGLTGSGKSIMAHFICRQLHYSGILARWVHEGEDPNPVLIDMETTIDEYMAEVLNRWKSWVEALDSSDEIVIIEASFFNNLMETLFIENVDPIDRIKYFEQLLSVIEPLDPMLVYLVQENVDGALERNFRSRGDGFRDFVIQLTTETPVATCRGWQGYEGMTAFWREFVAMTDDLFDRWPMRKIRVDNTDGNWDDCNLEVLHYLDIPYTPEFSAEHQEAPRYIGMYRDPNSGRIFDVAYEDEVLTINVFINVRTRLVRVEKDEFITEGWHFRIIFKPEDDTLANVMRIEGRDIDYLKLVGTQAERVD